MRAPPHLYICWSQQCAGLPWADRNMEPSAHLPGMHGASQTRVTVASNNTVNGPKIHDVTGERASVPST